MSHQVQCIKLGTKAEGLDAPPYPGELGERLYQQVSKEAWQTWLGQQTMLINEYKLNLGDAKARTFLLEETEKYFFGAKNEPNES